MTNSTKHLYSTLSKLFLMIRALECDAPIDEMGQLHLKVLAQEAHDTLEIAIEEVTELQITHAA